MPENWQLPQLTSNYATGVLQAINNKFIDTITLFRGGLGSNLPTNAIRFNGDLNGTFQRWNGTAWNDMVLGVLGGGTGSSDPAGIRTNLGLGTMSVQNSNAVSITGGDATGLGTVASNIGAFTTLHATDGSNIYNLDGAKIGTGIINPARLGNGLANISTFLRGDNIWAAPAGTLPSGLIGMFATACPAGWTRFTPLDGRFPIGSTGFGATGGQTYHTHDSGSLGLGPHTHDAGSLVSAPHNHGGSTGTVSVSVSGNTSSHGGHTHGYGGSVSGTTGSENNGNMNVDAGNSGIMARYQHEHNFSANYVGNTDSGGSHTHTFSGSGSGNGSISSATPTISGSTGAATGGLTGAVSGVDIYPPYIGVVFCQKD